MAQDWTPENLEELAREHIEYAVRKLTEYVDALEQLGPASDWIAKGHGATGQALLDASLLHLRNLHEFLHPQAQGSGFAHAGLYARKWKTLGFLSRTESHGGKSEYDRINAKVAHLSKQRQRTAYHDWEPADIRPLALRCCELTRDFLDALRPEWVDAFATSREHVEGFLSSQPT